MHRLRLHDGVLVMVAAAMTEPAGPRIILPEVVNLPAEVADMDRLRSILARAETDDEQIAAYVAMAHTGARYRAEVAVLMAAGLSLEDSEAVGFALVDGYCDVIRSIGHDGLAAVLVDVARRSFGRRLQEMMKAAGPAFGSA